jgi:hypothetical protein
VARLLFVACGTGVPIFHVKTTRETDVLIGPIFLDVGISGLLLVLHSRLLAGWDIRYGGCLVLVGDHLVYSNMWHGRSNSTAATTVSDTALTTMATTASDRILGTPWLGGKNLCRWWGKDLCSGGANFQSVVALVLALSIASCCIICWCCWFHWDSSAANC